MRKKSHISLGLYIADTLGRDELMKHRKAFVVGNVLPDCRPSFITQRHEYDSTFEKVCDNIDTIIEHGSEIIGGGTRLYSRLGEVNHYIADYFTFPHNSHYTDSIKAHCIYEKHLKNRLKQYIRNGNIAIEYIERTPILTKEDLVEFIRQAHDRYMMAKRCVEEDCRYIVSVCIRVIEAIIELIGLKRTEPVMA